MARTSSRFVIRPWKVSISLLLVFTQVWFGMSLSEIAAAIPLRVPAKSIASVASSTASLNHRPPASVPVRVSEFSQLASRFEEPLIATGPTSAHEDADLRKAMKAYMDRTNVDDFSALDNFLKNHPHSVWRVALLTNLGLAFYHYGYFSRAIGAWELAWREGKPVTEPKARALVDRAIGELLRMHARLGHSEALADLMKEIGDRQLTGPATEALTGAKEGLWTMQHDPGLAFLCGPLALKNLLLSQGTNVEQIRFLDDVRSGRQGVSLGEVGQLAAKAKVDYRLVFREQGQAIPVPSVVHWKVTHFAAIVGESNGRFHIQDPTFGAELWVTRAALESESSGYFLVPGNRDLGGWRTASKEEADRVHGMGMTSQQEPGATTPCDIKAGGDKSCGNDPNCHGMCGYKITEMVVSVNLTDTPVGYTPPVGPDAHVTLTYNQREANQPATFGWFNISPKWTINWLSYIQDDPTAPGVSIMRYVAGGGSINYSGFQNATDTTATPEVRDASVLVRASTNPITYQRNLSDGSFEVYSQSNGATTYPRRIFLTKIVDRTGNAVTLNYDGTPRLISLTDATGRLTTFSYELPTRPLLVTTITDPFGRSSKLSYDVNGKLTQIADVLNLTSQFSYDASGLINAMTTPYGTTHFAYGDNLTTRFVNATDPLGHTERVEFRHRAPGVPEIEPANTVPTGLNFSDDNLNYRNSFYWDRHVFPIAVGDYTKARITHWHHLDGSTTAHSVESIENPLENRVWYRYLSNFVTYFEGVLDKPIGIGRVLDDGTSQESKFTYNALGNVTDEIDPVGRERQFVYAANGIDVLTVKQKTSPSVFSTIGTYTYNTQHLPLTYTDAAGKTTTFTYNPAGQLAQITNALGEVTQNLYDSLGYLTTIINPNGKVQSSYTRDAYGRVATATDSEGFTIGYAYDAFDRKLAETYPDGTARQYSYSNLDLSSVTDRQGKVTRYDYDAVRNLVQMTDPLGNKTTYGYYENQVPKSITDANGNTTTWDIDIESRVTGKHYADGTLITNIYEDSTNRLKSVTDALAQTKQIAYAIDNALAGISYSHAVNQTPNVSFAYDPFFPRPISMTDGSGTTIYSYYPIGVPGALQPQREATPFSNGSIAYVYDGLSRLSSRTVDSSPETFAYDKLSRVVNHGTAMGSFNLGYLGQTDQMISQQISSGTVGTSWTYDTNTNGRRLKSINNSGATRSFSFTTTTENLISQIQETAPPTAAWAPKSSIYSYDDAYRLTHASTGVSAYDYVVDPVENIATFQSPSGTTNASYNRLNQISALGGQTFHYDANGNVLDDGLRTYLWDVENRLLSITPKANPSQKTTFRYDGESRRIAMVVSNGAMTTETRYLWCGKSLCQARTSADVVSRRYYPEGEYIPLSATGLYYSQDQIGSVRDVLSTSNGTRVASFDYDPYGNPSQSNGRLSTDLRYAGMLYDQQDGLYLTNYRVYSPAIGRWLTRDPIAEQGGINIYAYVNDNPAGNRDTAGLSCCGSFTESYNNAYERADRLSDALQQLYDFRQFRQVNELRQKYGFFDQVLSQSRSSGGLFNTRIQTIVGESFFREFVIEPYLIQKGAAGIGATIDALACPFEDSILDNRYVQQLFSLFGLDYSVAKNDIGTAPMGWSYEDFKQNTQPLKLRR